MLCIIKIENSSTIQLYNIGFYNYLKIAVRCIWMSLLTNTKINFISFWSEYSVRIKDTTTGLSNFSWKNTTMKLFAMCHLMHNQFKKTEKSWFFFQTQIFIRSLLVSILYPKTSINIRIIICIFFWVFYFLSIYILFEIFIIYNFDITPKIKMMNPRFSLI